MTNKLFCYWLQGYFEIDKQADLSQIKILKIKRQLASITEPLGPYTEWLKKVCDFFELQKYRQATLNYFQPIIEEQLASIFHHVIDEDYEVNIDRQTLQAIHDGTVTA